MSFACRSLASELHIPITERELPTYSSHIFGVQGITEKGVVRYKKFKRLYWPCDFCFLLGYWLDGNETNTGFYDEKRRAPTVEGRM